MNPTVTIHLMKEDGLELWATLMPPKNEQGAFEPVRVNVGTIGVFILVHNL